MNAPELPAKLTFRIEWTEYAEIEVDVAGLVAEWRDEMDAPVETREDVVEVLNEIGARDLMFDGGFVRVLEHDTEDSIR